MDKDNFGHQIPNGYSYQDMSYGNPNFVQNEDRYGKKPNHEEQDVMQQLSEALYNLQSDIDLIKTKLSLTNDCKNQETVVQDNSSASVFHAFEAPEKVEEKAQKEINDKRLVELENKVDLLVTGVREVNLNSAESFLRLKEEIKTEIEEGIKGIREDVFNLSEENKELKQNVAEKVYLSIEDKLDKEFFSSDSQVLAVASQIVESFERKLDMKFSDLFLELNKVKQALENQEYIQAPIANQEVQTEKIRAVEIDDDGEGSTMLTGEVIANIYGRIERLQDTTMLRLDSIEKLLDRTIEAIAMQGAENPQEILEKLYVLDDKLTAIENSSTCQNRPQGSFDYSSNTTDFNNEISKLKEDIQNTEQSISASLDDKLELLRSEIEVFKGEFKEENPRIVKKELTDLLTTVSLPQDENTGLMLQKIYNTVSSLLIENRNKFGEIEGEFAKFKSNFAYVTENVANDKNMSDKELTDAFSSLKGELDSLTKLLSESEAEKEISAEKDLPEAIKNASEQLDSLTNELIDDKEEKK